jgi:hypothetical protein
MIGAPASSTALSPSLSSILVSILRRGQQPPKSNADEDFDRDNDLYFVENANEEMRGTKQRLNFLAKRLLVGQGKGQGNEGKAVLLGTPLYVSMVD